MLVVAAIVAVAVYFGSTFWSPVSTYLRIRADTRRLAIRTLTIESHDPEAEVRRFLHEVGARDKVTLHRSDIALARQGTSAASVSVRLVLPYHYPFTDTQRFWHTSVDVSVERTRGF